MEKFSSVETNLTFNSIKSLITSMCLILTIILSCFCGILTVEGSLNFKYQAYETSRLCPDLQDSIIEYDENSQDKSSFQLFKYWQSSGLPCLLKSFARGVQKRTALIAGIHVDSKPWKFSGDAKTCREHIKVRLPKYYRPAKSDDDFEMVCRVPKRPELFVNLDISDIWSSWFFKFALRDMDYHIMAHQTTPSLYNLQNRKLVINFSNVNLTHSNDSDLVFSEHQKDYWLQRDRIPPSWTNFIQIIFIVRTAAGDCYVQVQQYLIKGQNESSCQYLHQVHPFRLCGVYECYKIKDILRVEDSWEAKTPGSLNTPYLNREIVFRSSIPTRTRPKRREPYIGSKLKIVAFLVVVSLLISGVCYVFGVRHRTSTIGNGDSQIRNCNGNSDNATVRPPPTTTVVMVVTNYEVIPLVQIGAEEEPPPSYNSLDTLPTYEEATTLGRNS